MDFAAADLFQQNGTGLYVHPKWPIEISFSFSSRKKMIAKQIFRDKIYLEIISNPFKNLTVFH